jgi:hypothetical protein
MEIWLSVARVPHLAIKNKAQVLLLLALAGHHLVLHKMLWPAQLTQDLLQLRRPQLEKSASLMQPVTDEPASRMPSSSKFQ